MILVMGGDAGDRWWWVEIQALSEKLLYSMMCWEIEVILVILVILGGGEW